MYNLNKFIEIFSNNLLIYSYKLGSSLIHTRHRMIFMNRKFTRWGEFTKFAPPPSLKNPAHPTGFTVGAKCTVYSSVGKKWLI